MENNLRAKQFMPFDALKGYKEAIKEKQKIVVRKKELSDDELELLTIKINHFKKNMIVKIVSFLNNEYILVNGMVSAIDFSNKTITIVKQKLNFSDIIEISCEEIEKFF